MRPLRAYRLCLLLTLPLFALRLFEQQSGAIERPSGFLASGFLWYHAAVLLLIAGCCCALRIIIKKSPESGEALPRPGASGALLLLLSGAAALVSGIVTIKEIGDEHLFIELLMSRAQLLAVGASPDGFKLRFAAAAAGFIAALWFFIAGIKAFKKAPLWDGGFLALCVPLWPALTAISRFAHSPVNARDSVSVTQLAACMALALACCCLTRGAALAEGKKTARRAAVFSLLAVYLAAGIKLADIGFYLACGEESEAALTAALTLAALAAAVCAAPKTTKPGEDGEKNEE
ncbi:MAG: hypothetical protein Q4B42_00650 [Oscillospiraceae bacterium]|nr:hypothetical protein [Oscillospiraceae bacterium]